MLLCWKGSGWIHTAYSAPAVLLGVAELLLSACEGARRLLRTGGCWECCPPTQVTCSPGLFPSGVLVLASGLLVPCAHCFSVEGLISVDGSFPGLSDRDMPLEDLG